MHLKKWRRKQQEKGGNSEKNGGNNKDLGGGRKRQRLRVKNNLLTCLVQTLHLLESLFL